MRRCAIARHSIVVPLSAAIALVASACSGSSSPQQPTPAAQGVAVQVSPTAATVATGGSTTFAATVTGTANTAVTWTVVEAGGGTIDGTGHYTAPASAGAFTVRATSVADTTVHADAAVTVTSTAPPPAVTVSVSPSPAATNSCLTVTFTATVANTTNHAVTWSVQEGAAGGTITSGGVYTAPSSAGTYHVVATSAADPTKSAVSTVTVTDRILSVAVSPTTTTVAAAGTAQFSATVTTTCGTFAATAAP